MITPEPHVTDKNKGLKEELPCVSNNCPEECDPKRACPQRLLRLNSRVWGRGRSGETTEAEEPRLQTLQDLAWPRAQQVSSLQMCLGWQQMSLTSDNYSGERQRSQGYGSGSKNTHHASLVTCVRAPEPIEGVRKEQTPQSSSLYHKHPHTCTHTSCIYYMHKYF